MATTHYNTMSFMDETEEVGSFTVYNDAITPASLAGYLAQLTDFRAKTLALVLGTNIRNTWVGDADENPRVKPGNNFAQRENKLRVVYKDNTTGEMYEITIPSFNLALATFLDGGKDYMAITTPKGAVAAITDWITSFQALASPPENPGNGVTVMKMQYVGRNT